MSTIRKVYRMKQSDSVTPRAPFRLRGKQLFDDGDLLIATFEKQGEAERMLSTLNSHVLLTGAITEAIKLIDDDVDNALDARIVLYSALCLGKASNENSTT